MINEKTGERRREEGYNPSTKFTLSEVEVLRARSRQQQKTKGGQYTEIGLMKIKELTEGGYRLYDREDTIERLRMVKDVNGGYLSLADIKVRMS